MRFNNFFFVSLGAIPGALLRWHFNDNFTVNIIGAFLVGFLYAFQSSYRFKLIFFLGFCGSLTSFSTWMLNSVIMTIEGQIIQAILMSFNMILIGIISVYLGYLIGKILCR